MSKPTGSSPPNAKFLGLAAQMKRQSELAAEQLRRFVEERCVRGPGLQATTSSLFRAYTRWCKDNGSTRVLDWDAPFSSGFESALTALGLEPASAPWEGAQRDRPRVGIALRP